MCGRFALTLPHDAMARLFEAAPVNDLPPVPQFNICPTQVIHVVTAAGDGRQLRAMRWGFVPHWYKKTSDGPLLINARAETVAEKPAFGAAARARRCLFPADGFYEWTKGKDNARLPWYIRPKDGSAMVMAGIWQDWASPEGEHLVTCAIITTAASADMARLHQRMPLILAQEDWPLWLGEAGHGASALMRPGPEGRLEAWRVDPAVNSNRAEGAQLRAPLEGQAGQDIGSH